MMSQARGGLRTSFRFWPDGLDHTIEQKTDAGHGDVIPWTEFLPPSLRVRGVEPDAALSWAVTALALIGLFATLRGGPQPLTFALHAGVAAAIVAGLVATRGMRIVRWTRAPSEKSGATVLSDARHDEILGEIEKRRVAAILAEADPDAAPTPRARLRAMRRLREAEIAPETTPQEGRAADEVFRQRAASETVTITLKADYLVAEHMDPFDGGAATPIRYKSLPEPSATFNARISLPLAGGAIGWLGAAVFSYGAAVSAGVPADHYVGGPGLPRALADFGPGLLAMVAGVALVSRWTKIRYATPYPGVTLIRDSRTDAIVDAIEARRTAALRSYQRPDPADFPEERIRILDWLKAERLITAAEREAALAEGLAVSSDPRLDEEQGEERRLALSLH